MSQNKPTSKPKEKVRERDGYECRFCGLTQEEHKTKRGKALHVHHIIKPSDGGDDILDNLITVCTDCHNTIENTQAKALSRLKEKLVEREVKEREEEYKRRIAELEEKLESTRQQSPEVVLWPTESRYTIHVLVVGTLSPDVRIYTDRETAAAEYEETEQSAKLFTKGLDVAGGVFETVEYMASDNVSVKAAPNGGSYIEDGDPLDVERMRTRTVPDWVGDGDD